jgi:F-type H+-transporting ATPase subunit delta
LCKEDGNLGLLQKDVEKLSELVKKSEDFRNLINSPMHTREEQSKSVGAISKKIKLQKHSENLLRLMARKGRAYFVPSIIHNLEALLENERGEIVVEIVSAVSISKDQIQSLEKALTEILKKKAKIQQNLDKNLIGGMIIKIGSRMIDNTIKSKLIKLQNIMKEGN